jgi:hypothetical protein
MEALFATSFKIDILLQFVRTAVRRESADLQAQCTSGLMHGRSYQTMSPGRGISAL